MCESIGHRPLWGRCPKKEQWLISTKLKQSQERIGGRKRGKRGGKERMDGTSEGRTDKVIYCCKSSTDNNERMS